MRAEIGSADVTDTRYESIPHHTHTSSSHHTLALTLPLQIRTRVFAAAKRELSDRPSHSVILLMGGVSSDWDLYDTDVCKADFRQESFFQYLFGVNEPDCFGVLDLETDETFLFTPEVTDDSERWNGTRRPLAYHTQRYGFNDTFLTKDLDEVLQKRGVKHLFTLLGTNRDSGNSTRTVPQFDGIEKYTKDDKQLYPMLSELRVFKTPGEIEVLRIANLISSQAHVYVMRHIKADMAEIQLEALYKSWCGFHGGCRHMAYTCICGSGENGSILHYGHAARPNERILQDGDACVLDMGAEYLGYATDITRSYPVNGKFTEDQKIVHNAVYEAQQAVLKAMKPGVLWPDMHRLAEKVIIEHLLKVRNNHNSPTNQIYSQSHLNCILSLTFFFSFHPSFPFFPSFSFRLAFFTTVPSVRCKPLSSVPSLCHTDSATCLV